MLDQISKSCSFLLNNYPEAQSCKEYLESRLTKESQELFQFGYFPDLKNLSALESLIGNNSLKENKLLYSKDVEDSLGQYSIKFSFFENYPIILPFRDTYGNIVALVGRTLLSEKERKSINLAKYKNTVFAKGNYLFGLYENKNNILEKNFVYVVEGQFDTIKATEVGLNNIVGLGSSSMTCYQFCTLLRYANNIILLLDNDEAGEKGRNLIINKFGKFANIQNMYIPINYKDIDEYIKSENITDVSQIEFVLK